MRDVGERVRAVLPELLAEHAGRTVVIATHTVTIRAAVGVLAGLDPSGWFALRLPPASLSIVRVWPDAHEVTVLGCPSDI
jgi:broad specificity phosphatase PhoE